MTNKPTTIISLRGGLGNQLFQLAAAMTISSRNSVGLEWKIGKPRLTNVGYPELTSFHLPPGVELFQSNKSSWLMSKSTGYLLRMQISPRFYEKNICISKIIKFLGGVVSFLHFKGIKETFVLDNLGFSERKVPLGPSFLIGYFQSFRWAIDERTFTQLKQMSLINVSDLVQRYKEIALDEKPLVVHVRLGDYKLEQDFGILHPDYYRESINDLWNLGKYKKVWVFSDEIELAKKYFEEMDISIFRFISEIDDSASSTLEVMRHGFGYIIGNSSFSWWAAFLSYQKLPEVIAPFPWFKNIASPRDIIPNRWTTKTSKWS